MASATYFELKDDVRAFECHGAVRVGNFLIPAESFVFTTEPTEVRPDRSRLITVKWRDRTAQMFLLDLLEHGVRV